jgi:hypothetical protein
MKGQTVIFYNQIAKSTAHHPIRDRLCGEVLSDPSLFPELLGTALDFTDENHHKACWILELVLESNIQWLKEYCEDFTAALANFRHEGAMRSISKICMFAAQKNEKEKLSFLSDIQLNCIVTICFDWLIGDTKVASKAYAMRALYCIGKNQPWIHDELKQILPQGFPDHSPAYKAAAKDILRRIS